MAKRRAGSEPDEYDPAYTEATGVYLPSPEEIAAGKAKLRESRVESGYVGRIEPREGRRVRRLSFRRYVTAGRMD